MDKWGGRSGILFQIFSDLLFPHTLCNIFSNVYVYIIGRVNTSGRVQYSGLMMIKI